MTKPTKWVCAQRRLRSAWASAQSDQSLRCAFSGQLRTQDFFMRTAKTLIRLMPRLIWVFTGRTLSLLVLSCRGSFAYFSATPAKIKFRLFEDSPFGHSHQARAPRFSLPSLDFYEAKFNTSIANDSISSGSKSRGNLPYPAFNTFKQHISKTLPNRRFSQAVVGMNSPDC